MEADKATAQRIFRVVGVNDDQDTCSHCGKTGLKSVVWLQNIQEQVEFPVGSSCAAKMLGWTEKSAEGQRNRALREANATMLAAAEAHAASLPCPTEITMEPLPVEGTSKAHLGDASIWLLFGNAGLVQDAAELLRRLQANWKANRVREFMAVHTRKGFIR